MYLLVNPGSTADLLCTTMQVKWARSAKLGVGGFSEAKELWPLGTAWTSPQKLGSSKALTTLLRLTSKIPIICCPGTLMYMRGR